MMAKIEADLKIEADWLNAGPSLAVMAALEAALPGGVRFVGGCVRNTLMGRAVDDIDIATQLEPDQTLGALQAAGIRAIPTGIEHGTITAVVDGIPFEITSLRRDVETDGRRAVVAFTQDWAEDAQRRDFRMNALYATPDGTLFDPTGGGCDDALAGRVIFIGDGDQRLREDYLRILRFFRFNAWYGAGIDGDGLAACTRQVAGLEKISRERVWRELKKLLSAPDPATVIEAMARSGVLGVIGLDGGDGEALRGLLHREIACVQSPDPMQRLMALMARSKEHAGQVSQALRLSNAETQRLEQWAAPELEEPGALDPKQLRALLYRFGAEAVRDRVMLSGGRVREALTAGDEWQRPDFPLGGNDALAAGFKGPEIGAALRRAERYWVEHDFKPNRGELLKRLAGQ